MTARAAPGKSDVVPQKALARVATVGLNHASHSVLAECFRQFSIQTEALAHPDFTRLAREKFDACVLRLNDDAETILETIRNSRSNFRMVVYGVCKTAQEALRFSRYSINAVLDHPIERQNALKVVRATHLLVVHEFRRYVRVPIVSEVRLKPDSGGETRGSSLEISGGGMSVTGGSGLATGQNVAVSFELPGMAQTSVRGVICWIRSSEGTFGVRFDTADESRFHVRQWIDDFIERS